MKAIRTAKGERRAHRKAKERRRRDDGLELTSLGGIMDEDLRDQILASIRSVDFTAPWDELAPKVLPVLKRAHHPFPPDMAPLLIQVPPGIWTGFGIDFGPAFSHITATTVETWGVGPATLLATALDNLRDLTRVEPPMVQRFDFEGMGLLGIQGQGWGSALLLLPEILGPILGPGPRVLLAPVRNTIVALPDDVEVDVGVGIWHVLADGAHDQLAVDPLRWTGTSIVALDDRGSGLPN